jgi:spermidine/putrescine transport system substrate-binding protein
MKKITRRNFLKTISFIGLAGFLGFENTSCLEQGGENQLFIYNWPFYITDKVLADFQKETGISIINDNYSSNEELVAKLQAGASGYDLIFPSDYMVKTMINLNLLEELDYTGITNFNNIDDKFKKLYFDPHNKYSIPYLWGTTGIGYNSEEIKENITGWNALWNEKYKDRITMLDDIRSISHPPLKLLGYSINTTDEKHIEEAKKMLIKQKPLVKAYTSDTYVDFLKSGDVWLSHGYSGDVFQVIREKNIIKYVIPQEGSERWVDNMCIPKGARNKKTAELFINYLLKPEVIADVTNSTWYANPNKASSKFIKPEILNNKSIYPPQSILDKCEFQQDLVEANKLYEDMYNELKST